MKNFKLWINENISGNWFDQVPFPRSIGDFLIAAKPFLNGKFQKEANEFPIPRSVVDFSSLTPRASEVSQIGQVMSWVLEDGLFESLHKRKQIAFQSQKDLQSSMGNKFNAAFPRGINEQNVYTNEVFNNKYFQSWLKQSKIELEPLSPIVIRTNDDFIRLNPKEINNAIDQMNEQYGDLVQLQKLQYSGPNGLIEHIENGSWSKGNKPNENGRTGINLLDVVNVEKNKNKGLELGDLNNPVRKKGGSYERGIREMAQKLVYRTVSGLNKEINAKELSPEDADRLQELQKVMKHGTSVDFKQGSYASSKGYTQRDDWKAGDDPVEAASMGFLMRLGVVRNVEINKLTSGGDNEEIRRKLIDQFGMSNRELNGAFSDSIKHYTPNNQTSMWEKYGVGLNKPVEKLSLGSSLPQRGGNVLDHGFAYLKQLIKNGSQIEKLLKTYANDYITNGISLDDLVQEIRNVLNYSGKITIPGLPSKVQLGSYINAEKHGQVVNMQNLHQLMAQGYEWDFHNQSDVAFNKDPRGIMTPKTSAVLVNRDLGKKILVKRKGDDAFYLADLTDPTVGDRNNRYGADNVPFFMSGGKQKSIGGNYQQIGGNPETRFNQQANYSQFSNSPFATITGDNSNAYKINKIKYQSHNTSQLASTLYRVRNPSAFNAVADLLISQIGPQDPMVKQILDLAKQRGIDISKFNNPTNAAPSANDITHKNKKIPKMRRNQNQYP